MFEIETEVCAKVVTAHEEVRLVGGIQLFYAMKVTTDSYGVFEIVLGCHSFEVSGWWIHHHHHH